MDGWIEWPGGECPVDGGIEVVVRYVSETRDEAEYWADTVGAPSAHHIDWSKVREYRIVGAAN